MAMNRRTFLCSLAGLIAAGMTAPLLPLRADAAPPSPPPGPRPGRPGPRPGPRPRRPGPAPRPGGPRPPRPDRDRLPIAARVRVRAPEDPVLVPEVRGRRRAREDPVREDLRRAPAPRDPAPAARVMKPEGREASENSFMFNSGEKP